MKKVLVSLIVLAFMVTVSGVAYGRTYEDEMQAVRDYLNVVDAKLATAKQDHNAKRVELLHVEKAATLARWEKLKATMATPAPAPAPVVIRTPAPAPVIVSVTNTSEVGRGVAMYINGGLDAGLIGYAANLEYDLTGLPAEGIKLRVGATYVAGTNPTSNDAMQAICAKIGAVYYITPYLPTIGVPLTWYIGGAGLYPVRVTGGATGGYGVEAYLGTNLNIFEMGIINVEVGYGALKYSTSKAALKGLDAKIGYGIIF